MVRTVTLLLLLSSQSACSFLTGDDGVFRDRRGDYLLAPTEPDMRIPDNLDSYTLDQLYVIPEDVVPNPESFAGNVPRPKPLDTNRPEGVLIRRFSGENWIVIAAAPGQVWPRIRDFWVQQEIELDYENPVDGVMETVWLDAPGSDENQEKYRIRIEPGLHAGSSEIILIQISRPKDTLGTELIVWPTLSDSEDREFAMLQEVSQYLADRTDIYSSSSSSLLAGSLEGERKANLNEDRDLGPVLELRISLNRAWAQVGGALDQAGITVNNRDRDNYVFEVAFNGLNLSGDSPGFFSRVFGNGEGDVPMNRFQIKIEQTAENIRVTAIPLDSPTLTGLETDLLQAVMANL